MFVICSNAESGVLLTVAETVCGRLWRRYQLEIILHQKTEICKERGTLLSQRWYATRAHRRLAGAGQVDDLNRCL